MSSNINLISTYIYYCILRGASHTICPATIYLLLHHKILLCFHLVRICSLEVILFHINRVTSPEYVSKKFLMVPWDRGRLRFGFSYQFHRLTMLISAMKTQIWEFIALIFLSSNVYLLWILFLAGSHGTCNSKKSPTNDMPAYWP